MLEGKGVKAGPRPPPARLSGAQREADLKPVDQNPHGVPDPGSAGRHHDFGSFGGNCEGGEGRVRGDSAKKGGSGKRKRRLPSTALTHTQFPSPGRELGVSWPPEHTPALVGSTQCGQKTIASRCDEGSDQRRLGDRGVGDAPGRYRPEMTQLQTGRNLLQQPVLPDTPARMCAKRL